MHFSIFNAIFVYCKRELFFKQKSSFLILDLSLGFVVFVAYFYCFAFGYITNYAFCGQSAELHLESIATNIKKKIPAPTHPYQRWKNMRENNQLKCRHGLQMNHFKDSSLSLECANSREVILLWFCSDDHENWLSADNYLLEYQTKFNDKNI